MASEVIEGERYNGKADVYSFGILMKEVVTDLTTYPLFQKGKLSIFKFNNKVVKESYRPEFTFHIKESIKKLIEQCWAADPNERPTFEEIFNKLAFNIEDSVYDIFEDGVQYKFYLEDVDVDIDSINDNNNNSKKAHEINDNSAALIDQIKKDYLMLKKEIDLIKKDNLKLKENNKEIASLQQENNNLAEKVQSMEEENAKLFNKVNSLEEENNKIKADLEILKKKVETLNITSHINERYAPSNNNEYK